MWQQSLCSTTDLFHNPPGRYQIDYAYKIKSSCFTWVTSLMATLYSQTARCISRFAMLSIKGGVLGRATADSTVPIYTLPRAMRPLRMFSSSRGGDLMSRWTNSRKRGKLRVKIRDFVFSMRSCPSLLANIAIQLWLYESASFICWLALVHRL